MKIKILILLAIWAIPLLAQEEREYEIKGVLTNTEGSCAYFVNLRTDSIFQAIPIVNRQFIYKAKSTFSKQDIAYDGFTKYVYLFIDKRSNITVEELRSKIKNQLWVPNRDSNIKTVIMENITLEIADINHLSEAKITDGGKLTRLLDEHRQQAQHDKREESFIQTYPDSPLSLFAVETILRYYRILDRARAEQKFGNIEQMYNNLSDRLKQTELGIEIKKGIDKLEK